MTLLAGATPYAVPDALMATLQVTVLVLVAAGALVVIRTKDRVRLVLALSGYGVLLAIVFFVFQAPDGTLSELTVGAIVLPVILLLAIAKVSDKATGTATSGTATSGTGTSGTGTSGTATSGTAAARATGKHGQ
jgi:energy-converting hydrogenase B subunit D